MTTQQQAQSLRSSLADVLALFVQALLSRWRVLPRGDVPALRAALIELLPELVDDYGRSAAATAGHWYADTRDAQRVPGAFTPDVTTPDTGDYRAHRVDSQVNWLTKPLVPARDPAAVPPVDPAALEKLVLERLVDSTQTEILTPARRTLLQATRDDPGHPRYARLAQPGCCAFCALLATRGAVYYELTVTASTTKRRDSQQGGSFAGDGAFPVHNACRCQPVPSWDSAPYTPGAEVAGFQQAYRAAQRATDGSTKAVLAAMRRTLGVH